jgi:3',5'-cyclic AMP phosphodiesterase CpdA
VIVHVSDIHFGEEDKRAVEAAARFVDEHRPRLVIATGDLTAIGSRREMKAAFDWLRALPSPTLAVPGNHDTPYFGIWSRLVDPFGRFRRSCADVGADAVVDDHLAVAPVNTARGVQWRVNWALGVVSRAQTAIAAHTLSEAAESALKIVATHHPLVWPADAPIAGSTRGGAGAFATLMRAGADMFVSGHLHRTDVRPLALAGRTAVSVSAGTLSTRYRGEPCSFIVIRRPRLEHVEIEQIHIVGPRAESARVAHFELAPRAGCARTSANA